MEEPIRIISIAKLPPTGEAPFVFLHHGSWKIVPYAKACMSKNLQQTKKSKKERIVKPITRAEFNNQWSHVTPPYVECWNPCKDPRKVGGVFTNLAAIETYKWDIRNVILSMMWSPEADAYWKEMDLKYSGMKINECPKEQTEQRQFLLDVQQRSLRFANWGSAWFLLDWYCMVGEVETFNLEDGFMYWPGEEGIEYHYDLFEAQPKKYTERRNKERAVAVRKEPERGEVGYESDTPDVVRPEGAEEDNDEDVAGQGFDLGLLTIGEKDDNEKVLARLGEGFGLLTFDDLEGPTRAAMAEEEDEEEEEVEEKKVADRTEDAEDMDLD